MPPKYSVVVPLHNEESSIRELYARLTDVMTGRYEPVEFVFVDDHSDDGTALILAELAGLDRRVVALRLKRNYGQTVALSAGFDYAAGEIIISMDGDLQHDPADIPAMLDAFEATDSDIVSGWREKRVDNYLLRRLPSRVANWMMAKFSGVDIHDFGTTFKVYRRETIKDIRLYGELHRFIPALAAWNGAKVTEVPIKNIVRPSGQSHYGISRTIRVFFDLLTIRFLLRFMTRNPGRLWRRWDSDFSVFRENSVRDAFISGARSAAGSGHDAFLVWVTGACRWPDWRIADADAF